MNNLEKTFEPFDKHIPVPTKGSTICYDKTTYAINNPGWSVIQILRKMQIGDSCLLSNWATSSITHAKQRYGLKFVRQLQPDGTVRVWRVPV
jgi:hypothetical protein